MVAVPQMRVSPPVAVVTDQPAAAGHRRRVVAVAVSAMELFRPASDLVRLIENFAHVDLLLATEDVLAAAPGPVGVLTPMDDADAAYDDGPDDEEVDEVRERAAELDMPGLHVHRLGLRLPMGPDAEADLVAAMSELVGFDPEVGVYCLAPAPAPSDLARAVVDRAAHRIAQVYGIPLMRYRCLELSVVGEDLP